MKYYPVFLALEGKNALVVGGGKVARRKVETLVEYGALVQIISMELTDGLKKLVEDGKIIHLGTKFEDHLMDGIFLVIAATDDHEFNHKISESARRKGLLINAVDQPADCDFIVPSIVKRGDLQIAISTSGKSPALAKKIRKELETQFGDEYESFLYLMGRLRKEILKKEYPQDENMRIFQEIVNSGILTALTKKNMDDVELILKRILPQDLSSGHFI
ncbi:MAG: bifunctional precorrin-2 dehydrogenase/sirohydrochlorin ferrochelatase [Deltaproteobacteria bacterium]|nr:bifunctional precorrin-2 dehydrogenase/sirohydrochlorin ferrochelatase [Deltaproteobacteria bacterium]